MSTATMIPTLDEKTARLPMLTASRLKDERACLRLGKYKYRDGYRAVRDSDAIRFGHLFHGGLESWWKCPTRDEAALRSGLEAIAAGSGDNADPFDRVRAEIMFTGYHYRWIDEPLEALAVEAEFRAPLINPATGAASRTFQLAGKVDGIARETSTGRVVLVEHKTSSEDISPGSDYRKRLRMDGQISVYYAGAAALGYTVEACIYDVIHKPTIRPLKATPPESRKYTKGKSCKVEHYDCADCTAAGATGLRPCHSSCRMCPGNGWLEAPHIYAGQREADETPEEFGARLREDIAAKPDAYYQHFEVVRLEAELEEAAFDTWQTAQIIRDAGTAGRFPRNPGACLQWGKTCAYFDVCSGEASLEDETRFVRVENLHPELSL